VASSRSEAVGEFLAPLQLAVSCVSRAVLAVIEPPRSQRFDRLRVLGNRGEPIWLTGAPVPMSKLGLAISVDMVLMHDPDRARSARWTSSTTGYLISFVDDNETEIVAYHWHSVSEGTHPEPHLHIGSSLCYGSPMQDAHFPTALVGLHRIVRMAITEWEVPPRRSDWIEVLDRLEATAGSRP
jgi:hypothetical protein